MNRKTTLALLFLALFFSCSQKPEGGRNLNFKGSIEELSGYDGSLSWDALSEQAGVWSQKANVKALRTGDSFSATIPSASVAYYPYRPLTGDLILKVPSIQNVPSSGAFSGKAVPMAAQMGQTGEVVFKHLAGYVEFDFVNSDPFFAQESIKSLTISSKDSIAGGFSIEFDPSGEPNIGSINSSSDEIRVSLEQEFSANDGGSIIATLLPGEHILSLTLSTDKGSYKFSDKVVTVSRAGLQKVKLDLSDSDANKPKGPRAVLLGDSITELWSFRTGNKSFFKNNDFVNKGIGGQVSEQLLARFDKDVIALDPRAVAIECGVNDFAGNSGVEQSARHVYDNIVAMAQKATSKRIKVVICSTPPSANCYWLSAQWNKTNRPIMAAKVKELNSMLLSYAKEQGFAYCDYYSALKNDDGEMKAEYWFDQSKGDGVHPNAAGYAVMEPIIEAAANEVLK